MLNDELHADVDFACDLTIAVDVSVQDVEQESIASEVRADSSSKAFTTNGNKVGVTRRYMCGLEPFDVVDDVA